MPARIETMTNFDDAEFDELWEGSYKQLVETDGYYPWPDTVTDPAEKKRLLRSHLKNISMMPNSLCLRVISASGTAVAAFYGYVDRASNSYIMCVGLTKADANGSKAILYDKTFLGQLRKAYAALGFERMIGFMPKNSPMKTTQAQNWNKADADYVPDLPEVPALAHRANKENLELYLYQHFPENRGGS